jgi:hypothetical protein
MSVLGQLRLSASVRRRSRRQCQVWLSLRPFLAGTCAWRIVRGRGDGLGGEDRGDLDIGKNPARALTSASPTLHLKARANRGQFAWANAPGEISIADSPSVSFFSLRPIGMSTSTIRVSGVLRLRERPCIHYLAATASAKCAKFVIRPRFSASCAA